MENIFTGRHVLRKDISHGRTCLIGGYVLLETMSYGRTSYGKTCFIEGHVYRKICPI